MFYIVYQMSCGILILSFFRNMLSKKNNGAQLLDSFYHKALKILKSCVLGVKTLIFHHKDAMLLCQ